MVRLSHCTNRKSSYILAFSRYNSLSIPPPPPHKKAAIQFLTLPRSTGQKLGIQLAHAGRKASTVAPWLTKTRGVAITATEDAGGWPSDVFGPSAIGWGEGFPTPREMTLDEIAEVTQDFVKGAERAVKAGVDVIEIHGAHGYLINSFLSPLSNQRTDAYGGSFENRIRLLLDVIKAVRKVIPETMPLLVRVSATEWMGEEGAPGQGWSVNDTKKLAPLLPALGVDLLDVSSGGNSAGQHIGMHNADQVDIAGQIRELGIEGLKIGAVGMITEAEMARSIVQSQSGTKSGDASIEIEDDRGAKAKADVVLVARQFLREPEWVLRVAQKLNVKVQWPNQYSRGTFPKDSRI